MQSNPEKEARRQQEEAKTKANVKQEKKKPTKEQILEKKISMARERGSRVVKINSPLGSIMFNVLRQFDQAYANFKGRLGEPGGISYEEGAALMEEAREITLAFSNLTARLSKKIKFRYFVPQELMEVKGAPEADSATEKGVEVEEAV